MSAQDSALREQLAKVLEWGEAHVDFDTAVEGIPRELRGRTPGGLPYSPWQLLEHLRITQHDILDFSRNPDYREIRWPDDYWPDSPAPPDAEAWDRSVAAFRADRAALQAMARDPSIDLFAQIPHGTGQTYIREILLAADHAAYHIGELVAVRRMLGAWKKAS
ncbi:DinB family protein [Longimicrobium sp.]|uniref:DinB family protein n=1 Tax=Longimicrobium sp. TaxID=2029185 RepID=UPI002C895E74|nr:DinB family protein [Longimicrobium sp.]HSU17463.1 DinB family protein [Longimicrobium sp.]